jgi:hypothetical protein
MSAAPTRTKTASLAGQIAELEERRTQLHAEMVSGLAGRVDEQWFRDRANELDHLNRSLVRLRVLHETSAA